jgi:2,3-bisphosphoglycerate-independent phosphoglycerate mutase
VLLLFVDGIGLAPAGEDNPFSALPAPGLDRLVGGPLTLESAGEGGGRVLVPLDAGLGVPGLPQSATGQTALFTGVNASALLGHHLSAYPGPRLRAVIDEHSLFRRAREAGLAATFANAYTPGYLEVVARGERRPSVTTCAVLAAALPLRSLAELEAGRAVTWDVCRDLFGRRGGVRLPAIGAPEAGRHLAALAADHDLTVFETFLPDLAGHRRFDLTAAEALARLDGLAAGLVDHLDPGVTLVLTSDHGNFEDQRHKLHTENPVPLLARGPAARRFAGLRALTEVTPRILEVLGGADPRHPGAPTPSN